jgi:subfamily B ATP-binding cassette protein MsbA
MLARLAPFVKTHLGPVIETLGLILLITAIDMVALPVLLSAVVLVMLDATTVTSGVFAMPVLGWDLAGLYPFITQWRGRPSVLLALAGTVAAIVLVKLLAELRRVTLRHRVGQAIGHDLRMTLFGSLVAQPVAFHEGQQAGGLLSRVTNDIDDLQERISSQAFEIVHTPLAVAIGTALLLALSWKLVLVTLALAPLMAIAIARMSRRVHTLTTQRSEAASDLSGYLAERLANVRTIQGFGREPFEVEAVRRLSERYADRTSRASIAADRITPMTEFLALASVLVGGVAGGTMVLSGTMRPQHLVLFFTVAPTAINRISHMTRMMPVWQQLVARAQRVFALLDLVPAVRDKPGAVSLGPLRGHVVFERVSFGYQPRPAEPALVDVDLDIQPGETIAIVGPSGAGKTTLVSLLPRFFDPATGRILIDGHDVRDVTLVSLRSQIGLVSQDAILFNRTIRDNIGYGRPGATDADIEAAADAAYATEFVARLPQRFDTIVGERGVALSAGQRQRLAIARAVLRDPRLVILDEATSALDSESERLVQLALGRFVAGRTTLVIAHRLSTIRHASRIVVLDRGRVVQVGPHEVLIREEGLYRRLHDLQMQQT